MKLFTYGDSWTSGDGISKHLNQKKYCWPARLGEMLDKDLNFDFHEEDQETERHCLFNRSWGGISNYRLVDCFIENSRTIKKEDIVVFGLTDPARLTFWAQGGKNHTPLSVNSDNHNIPYLDEAVDVNFVDLLGSDKENILFRIGLLDEGWIKYNLWLHIIIIQEICKRIGCKYFIFAPFFKHFRNHHDSTDYFDFSKPPNSFSKIIDYKHIAKKSAMEEVLMKDGRRIKYLFAVREAGHPWPAQKHPNEDGYFEIAKWVYKKLGELDVSE